jgi:hypothetical protein
VQLLGDDHGQHHFLHDIRKRLQGKRDQSQVRKCRQDQAGKEDWRRNHKAEEIPEAQETRHQAPSHDGGVAWNNRHYYCDAEQLCQPIPEPELSVINVQKTPITEYIMPGIGRRLFSFALSVASGDPSYDEDSVIQKISMSIVISDQTPSYGDIKNCVLEVDNSWILSYQEDLIFDEESTTGRLEFNLPTGTEIPQGSVEHFNVFCDITIPTNQNFSTPIEVGFIPALGTGPAQAIKAYGVNTAEQMEVEPDMPISTTVFYN